ncbi:MAG: RibD family protein [Actinobacteria bacterium]|nr:MAG: RibD family protein [Actinomycetota bacterium]
MGLARRRRERMLPRVILYNAVSLDGRIDGFMPDIGLFYKLAGTFKEDAILAGSETILAGLEMFGEDAGEAGDGETGASEAGGAGEAGATEAAQAGDKPVGLPLLVVIDSRGRIRPWERLKAQPYWGDVLVACSESTPKSYLEYLSEQQVPYVVTGSEKVDPRALLEKLSAGYGVEVVRVDSGGTLNGVLLRAGLVDEVSVLIHPVLVGGASARSIFGAPDPSSLEQPIALRLAHMEQLEGGLVWLRYEVTRSRSS